MHWNGIIRCNKVQWNSFCYMTTYQMCLIVLIGCISFRYCYACPVEARDEAFSCFEDYSNQKVNLDRSERQLYSGIDVETLRAFCSSFIAAMTCVTDLVRACPPNKHADIEMALVNFQGSETVLANLCKKEGLYEVYAQYQTCFYTKGAKSEQCFEESFNSTIQMMSSFEYLSKEALCSKLQKTTKCIQSKILQGCGEKAAGLVELLVKPMVLQSNSCDLDIVIQTTKTPPSSGDNKPFKNGQNGGSKTYSDDDTSSCRRLNFDITTLIVVFLISNFIKPQTFS